MGHRSGRWALGAFVSLLVMVGCGSTRIVDTWQAPGFKRDDLNQVLIVAVSADMTNRIQFERSFARELRQKGIDAIASYEVLGSQLPTRDDVVAYLAERDIPHLIIAEYGGASVTQVVAPDPGGDPTGQPLASTYGGFWDRQEYLHSVGQGGTVDYTQRLILTTSIYAVDSQNLLWRGQSNTFEVTSVSAVADAVARAIWGKIDT
jgi:hypothetical protein